MKKEIKCACYKNTCHLKFLNTDYLQKYSAVLAIEAYIP